MAITAIASRYPSVWFGSVASASIRNSSTPGAKTASPYAKTDHDPYENAIATASRPARAIHADPSNRAGIVPTSRRRPMPERRHAQTIHQARAA